MPSPRFCSSTSLNDTNISGAECSVPINWRVWQRKKKCSNVCIKFDRSPLFVVFTSQEDVLLLNIGNPYETLEWSTYGKILEPRESQMLLLFASDCGQSWGKGTAGTIPSPFLRCRLTNRGNQGAGSWWTTPAHTNVPMWETVSVETNHGNQPAASCRRPNF